MQAGACKPSLIITDLKMPKMDGLEMISRLREAGCEAYVIILTAQSQLYLCADGNPAGRSGFFIKAVHDGDLENAVLALQEEELRGRKSAWSPQLPEVRAGAKSRDVQEAMDGIGKSCKDPGLSVGQAAAGLGLSEGPCEPSF